MTIDCLLGGTADLVSRSIDPRSETSESVEDRGREILFREEDDTLLMGVVRSYLSLKWF
jgi:hypothetical protein